MWTKRAHKKPASIAFVISAADIEICLFKRIDTAVLLTGKQSNITGKQSNKLS